MKIVIDIPEEEYEKIKTCTSPMVWTEHLIKNGTPLDDIKAEILDCMTDGIEYYDQGRDDGLKLASLIIDKHIRKEKE